MKIIDVEEVCREIKRGQSIKSIAADWRVSRSLIHKRLKSAGIAHQKLKFDHDYFEAIDDEHKAYWLGFLMADGCVSLTQQPKVYVHLKKVDARHLEKFHRDISSIKKVLYAKDGSVASSHYSRKMCEDLTGWGCTSRKSLTLLFPKVQEVLVPHVVRGYFDGDGCFYFNKRTKNAQISIVGTKSFLDGVQYFCGTSVKLSKPSKAFVLHIHGNEQVRRMIQYMYGNSTIWLDRKLAKIKSRGFLGE